MISGVNAKVPVIYTLFPIDEAQLISMSTKIFTIVGGRGRGCGEGWEQGHHSQKGIPAVPAEQHHQPLEGPSRTQSIWWSRKITWSARRKARAEGKTDVSLTQHWGELRLIKLP